MIELSVVIPVYRSEATLAELYKRLVSTLEPAIPSFEIIFVEDDGGDGSWDVITQIVSADSRAHGLRLSRNFGQHAATLCGISHARGRWVATLDDDLEQAPEYLPKLYEKALGGYDLIYAVYPQRTHTAWRNASSQMARFLFKKAIPSLNYAYTSYRFIRGDIARALTDFDSPFPFIDGYLSWLTNRYATVVIPHETRAIGGSNYTLGKLIKHSLNIFFTFSDLPLKLATWTGVLFFVVGMGWLAFIIMGRLLGFITVSGFSSIMAAIIGFGGVQLFVLGIFGEYLGRMNFKSSKKPLFLIGQSVRGDDDAARRG